MAAIVIYPTTSRRPADFVLTGNDWRPPRTITYSFVGSAATVASSFAVPPTGTDAWSAAQVAGQFSAAFGKAHPGWRLIPTDVAGELEIRPPLGDTLTSYTCTTA